MDDEDRPLGAFADDAAAAHADQVAKGIRPARRGRPAGSANRKTMEFEEWFRAKGLEDPLLGMVDFYMTDPVMLQAWFETHERAQKALGKRVAMALPSLLDIVKLQMDLRAEVAPYLHGKMPIRIKVEEGKLPVLVLNLGTNQLDQARQIEGQRRFQLGTAINEISDLEPATKPGEKSDDGQSS